MATTDLVSLSPPAERAQLYLECLTQDIPADAPLSAEVLLRRAGLDAAEAEGVVHELLAVGVATEVVGGLAPTGKRWNGPTTFPIRPYFDTDIPDDVALDFPTGWRPGSEVLVEPDLAHDIREDLGILLVISVIHAQGEIVTLRRLRQSLTARGVEAHDLLELMDYGLLPEQPRLAHQLAEHRAWRRYAAAVY